MPLRQVRWTLRHRGSWKAGAARSPDQDIAGRVHPTAFRDGYRRRLREDGFKAIGDRRRVRRFRDEPDDRQNAGEASRKILPVQKATQVICRIVSRIRRREIDQRDPARRMEGDVLGGYLDFRPYLQIG